ncbi:putative E3 ubiquitin-protein ligase UBR7 [Maniola hyperantus]|uniref:putative E3 ubiquitin-protein ligase UBR7 n=1 Tax=Aphantopus hyperantus TaxID=2795564 RepID=UPI001567E774|nr:putative E3 ubiquitin-protein ligase UBR7 [Maniola hyperantus]
MATEPKDASEDTEMADCDDEKVVTMMDVLQEQEDFEEDVNAVLGASDEKDCTYSKGYIKRQALYACMTCCADAKNDPTKRAGVCLACSLTCHENHDLVELYTKRTFKCDCGNPKFNSHPCQFTPDKTDLNEENNYNQNFSGLYCVCQRPYPDPESQTEVEMIQCIICEDWLHASHLEATVPDNDQYSEMICKGCMEKNEFLHDYGKLAVNSDVDIITNGIDNDKMCNGDAKLETLAEDETVKATDVEMEEKPSDNITANPEESSEKTNGEDESKTEENLSDTKETSNERKDEENSVDTPAETEKATTETVNQEQQNENKEPATDTKQTESTAEMDSTESVVKSAEQLEEERLLADPDDYSKKLKADNKKDENSETIASETGDKPIETDENGAAKVDNEPTSGDKANESKNNEGSADTDKNSTEETASAEDKNVTAEVDMKDNKEDNTSKVEQQNETEEPKVVTQNGDTEVKISEKRKLSTEDDTGSDIKKVKLEETNECVRPKGVQKVHKGATFWPSTFRQKLCTCRECIMMYKDLSVLFLIDPEDTVAAYENLGKQKINGKPASQYEKGLQALSSLDRIQQINALTEYNKMRDKLLDFLKSFKDRREVVKEEDIKAFFAGMKPKREPDGVYFCR